MSRKSLLKESVLILGAPPHEQLEYLAQLGLAGCVDELALEFDDIAAAAEDMRCHLELTQAQCDAVKELDGFLASISGRSRANLWTEEALSTSAEWNEVRRLAKKLIDLL